MFKWIIILPGILFCFCSCEKEININLPKGPLELVVEASLNDKFPSLNYVYLTRTIDYFDLKLDGAGISGAKVSITEGIILGKDTIYDNGSKVSLIEIKLDKFPAGFYVNPFLQPRKNKVYKLEINYLDKYIAGTTSIPESTPFYDIGYSYEGLKDNKPRARMYMKFIDPPEPSFYRIGYTLFRDSNLLGWGASERIRLLNDETLNNQLREFNNFQDFFQGDTVNIYFARFGRSEYEFWRSFLSARNSESPFSTPAQLKSNIKGALGSFCGYSMEYKRVIIR